MNRSFSYQTRASDIAAMTAAPLDVLVIGGGITGAGIARDAAMRGLRTALVDRGDFASGTSGHSSRLIHGGLRYLELGDWRLVLEASRERRILLRIAPHLVRPQSFLFPVYEGARVPPWKLAAGLWLYDLLALFRNVRRHRMLSKQELLRCEPGLRDRGLRGGARYFDAQCDDARLTLANARDAHRHGALVANYVCMDRLEIGDGRVRGARLTDQRSGKSLDVRALVVVNATGPWSDALRAASGGQPLLRTTKGVHVAVPRSRVGNTEAITLMSAIDGRVMFVIPWGDLTYIGTTDTDADDAPADVRPAAEDVVYLLRSANAVFPHARLEPRDVISAWAGLRPLLRPDDPRHPSDVSREHRIVGGPVGLLSVVGGKLTTYRAMAAETIDRVVADLHLLDGRPVPPRASTDREPLPGGESRDMALLVTELEREGAASDVANHLVRNYGSEAIAIQRLRNEQRPLAQPLTKGHPVSGAEMVHAIRREMALTLSDLLVRRTHLFYEVPGQGARAAAAVVDIAGVELGWDAVQKAEELLAYVTHVERQNAFRADLARELDA
jgi:glycerol-3-phosphate dehydrogenase